MITDKITHECCASREATVIEILEQRRENLIAHLAKLDSAIKHFKGTSSFELDLLRTIFMEGQRS